MNMKSTSEFAIGLRLERLEVYNWGTFNEQIWPITPQGGTALLTGANGSGKSSLVDALLTLLVAPGRRNYNQSAGSEKRRERTEKTYVQGAYGKKREEDDDNARIRYLRGKDTYSVLLAVFQNHRYLQTVTLVQVFWWQENELRKLYIVAPFALSIKEHFRLSSVDQLTKLRKQLRTDGASVYDDFSKYHKHFRRLAYLRSDKASDLFNQIVSIKDIESLNGFVRNHMLEKIDVRGDIEDLHNTYRNLNVAYQAIQQAEMQLKILEPLIEDANKYEDLERRIRQAQDCEKVVPLFIASLKKRLLEEALTTTRQQQEEQEKIKADLESKIETLQSQEISLEADIRNDKVGQQIQELERDIKALEQQKLEREKQARKYNSYVRQLGLPEYSGRATFDATLRQIPTLLSTASTNQVEYIQQRDKQIQQLAEVQKICRSAEDELESLRRRKSQIPSQDIAIRDLLMHALAIPEEELPFVGELVRVRRSEQRWEGAIERLLRGFGRRLLVSENHYERVSRYVDSVNLRGRLVYSRIPTDRAYQLARQPHQQMLAAKLEVRPDTPFSDWLIHELVTSYDYLCCETIEEFQHARRALSIQGQIKHSFDRHEKDDRTALNDRTKYILGWNNTEKLAAIEADLAQLREKSRRIEGDKRRLEALIKQEQERQRLLEQIHDFDDFAAIDWHNNVAQIQELRQRKQELEQSSDQLSKLQTQLAEVKGQLKRTRDQRDDVHSLVSRLAQQIDDYQEEHDRCKQRLRDELREEHRPFLQLVENDAQQNHAHLLKLERMEDAKEKISLTYSRRASSLQGQQNTLRITLEGRMRAFRDTDTRIAQEVDASVEAIPAYRHYYEQIRRDDLPRHRQRFKELLNDKVILAINMFKETLDLQRDEIEANLACLNESLRSIAYTPSTYIQLCHKASRDPQIKEFHDALRDCFPDVSQTPTAEANESSFRHVQKLIGRFEEDERWTSKVTDVRNWMTFWAEELYREDDSHKNYYDDSSGLSGGQKAKLASTILASAIAYQYGLNQDESSQRALRFIVVDEAFSRSDEMNARYAMDLFKQLDLQVLIVTPLEKLHIVEAYISSCHYATNTEEGDDSKVYNLTIEEYHRQKQSWQEVVA
jgi:uncharacterized protein YPO0396